MPSSCFRLCGSLPHAFLLSIMVMTSTAYFLDPIEILKFMTDHQLSFEQVQAYFDTQLGLESSRASDDIPRLFPVCIKSHSETLSTSKSDDLRQFANILESMEKAYDCRGRALPFYAFNKSVHSTGHNTEWPLKITFSRLSTPDGSVKNMRQWMHINVETSPDIQYLYVQSIVGPLGLPSGQFSDEVLPCGGATAEEISTVKIIYCDYRSKADINHPVAYFGKRSEKAGGFRMNFKWHDITCLESPYLQFILIPIKTLEAGALMGQDFQPLLSPVYTNFEFDSRDGLVTPYYIDWSSEASCVSGTTALYHDGVTVPLQWKKSSVLDRLPFNEHYEKCLVGGIGKEEERKECPPGPFECPTNLSFRGIADSSAGFNAIISRRRDDFDRIVKNIGCLPCYLPSREEVEGCPPGSESFIARKITSRGARIVVPTEEHTLDHNELLNSPVDARGHGAIAMLIFLVILPISFFIGRFYRETVPLGCWTSQGDFWIIMHGILVLVGWQLMWISFGKVTTGHEGLFVGAEDCFESAWNNSKGLNTTEQQKVLLKLDNCIEGRVGFSWHATLGMSTAILYNLLLILGMYRNPKPHLRNFQVTVHSHVGYAAYIMGAVTIFYSVEVRSCLELIIWPASLIGITLSAFGIATFLTMKEDRSIGVIPRRRLWPIQEHIQLFDRSPIQTCKLILLGGYVGLLLIVWGGACASFALISSSETRVFGNFDSDGVTSGWLAKCRTSSLRISWK